MNTVDEHVKIVRDPAALEDRTFDVLVIGGGIHGLAIAYDAAARGLSTALVERGDFGGAASFNHQKTAHGGLRSLQTGDLRRARESVRERQILARIAPRLLRPLPFMIATYRSLTRSRFALRAAFRIDRTIGYDRNRGIEPELRLPPPRLVSRAAVQRLFPDARREGLTGGATWYDYQIVEADRLTIGVALAAAAHGAALINHVEAVAPLRDARTISGFRVRDTTTGHEMNVQARLTINAAGSRAGHVMSAMGASREFLLVTAMNLMTARKAGDLALAASTRDGRMLTLTPWRGCALVGTSQSDTFISPDDEDRKAAEIASFLSDANEAFPSLALTADAVTLVHHGIVPAERGGGGRPALKRRPELIDHARDGLAGAMTVIGVKYTTARAVAERAVDLAVKKLRKRAGPTRTAETILPGASIADHEALAIETEHRTGVRLSDASRNHITAVYGARCADIIQLTADDRSLLEPLGPGASAIGAEVVHAIRNEAALHLDDVLMRRCGIGAAGWPGADVVTRAAELAARELRWSEAQRASEIAALRARYVVMER